MPTNQDLEKRNKILERRWKLLFVLAIVFLVTRPIALFVVNHFIHKASDNAAKEAVEHSCTEQRSGGYRFVSPLLDCDSFDAANIELIPFQDKLRAISDKVENKDDVEQVSIYFRDLNNGPWYGVHEERIFTPASLFKLPIAVSIYKAAENGTIDLQKQITYDKLIEEEATQNIVPEQSIELGKTYAIAELVERMLVYSDNISLILLGQQLGRQVDLNKTYKDIGMTFEGDNASNTKVSTKSFATIYRMLFNASYLNKADSERLLGILSRSNEEKSLFEGVPSDITMAAKFGERAFTGESTKFLHNCGIIYYPNHPYILCIMTQGDDSKKLEEIIKQTSRTVYEEVSKQYEGK